jgi:plastocyanin
MKHQGTAFLAAVVFAVIAPSVFAADITGMVTVKQRLTRPSVTASVSMYERGPAVELGQDVENDPLAAERERVVIWIEGSGPLKSSGSTGMQASMQQANRRFEPDMVVVPAGGTVSFPNTDPIFHNVFSLSKPKSFDLGNYPKGDSRTVTFPKPGIVYVNCHLHPNMAGVIVVTPNAWYSKVPRDGEFAIHDVRPGAYTIVAWHKAAGFVRREIQVVDGHENVVNFLVPLDPAVTAADAKRESAHMQDHDMSSMKAVAR